MLSINKIFLTGNLGGDPEIKYLKNGITIGILILAVKNNTKKFYKINDQSSWYRVVLYEKFINLAKNFLKKGDLVLIVGSIKTRKWLDKKDKYNYITEIIAEEIQILDKTNEIKGNKEFNRSINTYNKKFNNKSDYESTEQNSDDDFNMNLEDINKTNNNFNKYKDKRGDFIKNKNKYNIESDIITESSDNDFQEINELNNNFDKNKNKKKNLLKNKNKYSDDDSTEISDEDLEEDNTDINKLNNNLFNKNKNKKKNLINKNIEKKINSDLEEDVSDIENIKIKFKDNPENYNKLNSELDLENDLNINKKIKELSNNFDNIKNKEIIINNYNKLEDKNIEEDSDEEFEKDLYDIGKLNYDLNNNKINYNKSENEETEKDSGEDFDE